mmetsp:Transcript_36323/g.108970  ORF Transcript_36323/g.108970 Transcript_36323/m.108970 type:complete len:212 (+) Transcript_36323:3996-4631(+)
MPSKKTRSSPPLFPPPPSDESMAALAAGAAFLTSTRTMLLGSPAFAANSSTSARASPSTVVTPAEASASADFSRPDSDRKDLRSALAATEVICSGGTVVEWSLLASETAVGEQVSVSEMIFPCARGRAMPPSGSDAATPYLTGGGGWRRRSAGISGSARKSPRIAVPSSEPDASGSLSFFSSWHFRPTAPSSSIFMGLIRRRGFSLRSCKS